VHVAGLAADERFVEFDRSVQLRWNPALTDNPFVSSLMR
jgi:hypothetical protein